MEELIYLTEHDKARFSRTLTVPAIRVPNKQIQTFLKTHQAHISHDSKPIQIPNDKEHKLIPIQTENGLIPPIIEQYVQENKLQTQDTIVQKSYKDFTYNEVLKELMPEDVEPPQGYETIGQIAHFNLKPEQYKYQKLIGQVLLDKNKQIRTVVNKTEKLHNVFRTPTLQMMAGEHNYSTCVPEGGCRFSLDFERVYWCTRLYSERTRVLTLVKPKEVILDLFCGIGPFAVRAAKQHDCLCIANDLNPECYKYLQKNIIDNNVQKNIVPLNMDAREVVRMFYKGAKSLTEIGEEFWCFDHVYMNLPVLALDFLDVFRGFSIKATHWNKQLPMIHVYGFIKAQSESDLQDCVQSRIKQSLPNFSKDQIAHFQIIKNVTAKKKMVCVSFRLNALDAALSDAQISLLEGLDQARQKDLEDDDDEGPDEEEPNVVKRVKVN